MIKYPKNLYTETKTNPQRPADQEFGTILKDRVQNLKNDVIEPRQTTYLNSLNGVQMNDPSALEQKFALDRIENIVGLLDQYRHKLADPEITLKNIDPIIREIDQETQTLSPLLDALPEDEQLNDLINQTLVAASLEVTKFYRGDYSAS